MTDVTDTIFLQSAPWELQAVIPEFWPEAEYHNAARIAYLESAFNPFALDDTTDAEHPCGAYLRTYNGIRVTAERSVGYYQINTCNTPGVEYGRFYNARYNAAAAYALWMQAGESWSPWYFSARQLGLV